MEIFREHMDIIRKSNFDFHNPNNFEEQFNIPKSKKKILITIDDAFESFYTEAWPYLKENKIPFILFVSTEPVGRRGYMTWKQIKEIESNDFAIIGHHSHTHEYLIDVSNEEFILDIETANKIFLKELGYIPSLFSYPFGEYSKFMRDYISKNFKYAFGQHSGVIDLNKNKFELPRFPINEKYGELKRFKSEQKNLSNISCYSNEGDIWEKSKTNFANNSLTIEFREPFKPRRGRINCSLNDNGKWRWFGVQFPIKVIEN